MTGARAHHVETRARAHVGVDDTPAVMAPPGRARLWSPAVIEIGRVGDTMPGSMYGLPLDRGRALFASARDKLSGHFPVR